MGMFMSLREQETERRAHMAALAGAVVLGVCIAVMAFNLGRLVESRVADPVKEHCLARVERVDELALALKETKGMKLPVGKNNAVARKDTVPDSSGVQVSKN